MRGKSFKPRRIKVRHDYNSKNLTNPFFRSRRKSKQVVPEKKTKGRKPKGSKRRIWLWFFVIVIPLAALAWLLFYSPVFLIKRVEVKGLQRISPEAVSAKVQEYIDGHPNLIRLDAKELSVQVNEGFNFEAIKAIKKWPSTVSLQIDERWVGFILNDSDGQQYLADSQGHVISGFSLSEEEKASYLTISNRGSQLLASSDGIDIETDTLSFIFQLYGIMKDTYEIEGIWVDDEANKVTAKLKDFPPAYFNVSLAPESQLENLLLVRSEVEAKEEGGFAKLSYVDLRYDNLVYYK